MRGLRRGAALLVLFVAVPLLAAEEGWYSAYNRGVDAVRNAHYQIAATSLQKAIDAMPSEGTNVRTGNSLVTYVPHFWLGIAKFNLGDVDGSLREWKISEDQGVVQSTMYYAQLRDWVSRAQTQKQRNSENDAAGSKRQANDAIGRATAAQLDAVGAGGDRTEQYRSAFAKLKEANDQFKSAGTDIRAYRRVSDLAGQAHDLFVAGAVAAQKAKAARVQQKPPPAQPQPQPVPVVIVPFGEEPPKPAPKKQEPPPKPEPQPKKEEPPPAPVVESKELVDTRIAVQAYRRHIINARNVAASNRQFQDFLRAAALDVPKLDAQLRGTPDSKAIARIAGDVEGRERDLAARIADAKKIVVITPPPIPPPTPPVTALETAWRAFAAGDLAGSEQQLTGIIASTQAAEAYLLRGCTRYTRGVLSGRDDALAAAAGDFRAALQKNAALRLDPAAFSPKLITFFEKVRSSS